jgi:hypothetical protein
MEKYFFDLVGHDHSEYDYQGQLLSAPEKALQLAELIALDCEMCGEGEWSRWTINVRNAQGQHFFAIPVREPELMVA